MDYLPQKANLLFLSVVPNAWHQAPGLTDVRLSSSGKESVSTVWQYGHFACNIKLLLLKPGELKVQEYYKSSFCEMFKKQTNKCLVPCSWTVFCLTVLSRLHLCILFCKYCILEGKWEEKCIQIRAANQPSAKLSLSQRLWTVHFRTPKSFNFHQTYQLVPMSKHPEEYYSTIKYWAKLCSVGAFSVIVQL